MNKQISKSPAQYAARLNSFKDGMGSGAPTKRTGVLGLLERAAQVHGLNAVDLNFPDHCAGLTNRELESTLGDLGLSINGFAMRYYSDPGFKLGAFTIGIDIMIADGCEQVVC